MTLNFIFRKNTQAWTASLLLTVFGILLAPPEFYHSFENHSDTHCSGSSDRVIEKQHQHCAILRFECPAFLTAANHATIGASSVKIHIADFVPDQVIRLNVRLPQLRAPPTV